MSDEVIRERLAICYRCPEYVNGLNKGACRLIRDLSARVSIDLYAAALKAGYCPLNRWPGEHQETSHRVPEEAEKRQD